MAAIYDRDIEEIKIEKMWKLLRLEEEMVQKTYSPVLKDQDDTTAYLNILSQNVKEVLKAKELIYFKNTPTETPQDPAAGTKYRPSFVAVVKSSEIAMTNGSLSCYKTSQFAETDSVFKPHSEVSQFHWSQLETTGEIKSKGNSPETSLMQEISYTVHLLQARPDLISVLGIFVDDNDFSLIFCSADGAYHTKFLKWTDSSAQALLCAWIVRLYQPFKDTSIERVIDSNVTFNVTSGSDKYLRCRIHIVGNPFGRRTVVFSTPGGNVFIKDQFVGDERRFKEGSILENVHESAQFPGIVRIEEPSGVDLGNAILEGRTKTRLVMLDGGSPFMEIKTPREALMIAYDLLEVTRFLYRLRQTLHRDISHSNVLVRDQPVSFPDHPDFQGMHFVTHLLGELGPDSEAGRLETKLLLIDFDMAQSPVVEPDGSPQPRTGTPIFMARAVRTGYRAAGLYAIYPMPLLTRGREHYARHLQERLDTYNDPMKDKQLFQSDEHVKLEPFTHRLRYDAESVFWLLLYWAIQAQPESDEYERDVINSTYWSVLTSGQLSTEPVDGRSSLIDRFPSVIFHHAYSPLCPLFLDMAKCLQGEGYFDQFDCKKKDEYLHEALQRLIFEFLVTNTNESFMSLDKSSTPRKLTQAPNSQPLTTSQIQSHRAGSSRPASSQDKLHGQARSRNSVKRRRSEDISHESSDLIKRLKTK